MLLCIILLTVIFNSTPVVDSIESVLGKDVCKAKVDPGPCFQFALRWYWDPETHECHQFQYGGCLGNRNQFLTKTQCVKACVYRVDNPVVPDACLLPRDSGYCHDDRAGHWYWYFDHEEGKCMQLYYYGCKGNDNRFSSLYRCQTTCGDRLSPKIVQCRICDSRTSRCIEHGKYNFTCECREGYVKNDFGKCVDVDECRSKNSSIKCHERAWCVNTEGSYRCTCMAGYKGDGKQCVLVGLGRATLNCANCHEHATCDQGVCQCNIGFRGDGLMCKDVDECKYVEYPCDPVASCTNTIGSFQCRCPEGYAGNGYNCTTSTKACLEEFDRGYKEECGGSVWSEHYYFDHKRKRCDLFWYDGCKGTSSNIFTDLATCEAMCERTKVLHRAEVCWDTFDEKLKDQCSKSSEDWSTRYTFDPKTLTCKAFWYSGCAGNTRNVFQDLPSCQWLCEIQPMYLSKACLEPFDTKYKDQCGGSGDWKLRYYYDKQTNKCSGFWWDQCRSSNQNFFSDQRTCQYLCESPALQAEKRKDPCQNGGTCYVAENKDHVEHRCECIPGFRGDNCTDAIDNPCNSNPCRNGGTCNPTIGNSEFWCSCPKKPGNTYTGLYCEMKLSVAPPPTQAPKPRSVKNQIKVTSNRSKQDLPETSHGDGEETNEAENQSSIAAINESDNETDDTEAKQAEEEQLATTDSHKVRKSVFDHSSDTSSPTTIPTQPHQQMSSKLTSSKAADKNQSPNFLNDNNKDDNNNNPSSGSLNLTRTNDIISLAITTIWLVTTTVLLV